jgi:serine/threonine protein kinase
MHKLFPGANPQVIDLMQKLLQFNPERRITVEQALEHPYLAALHDAAAEPSRAGPVDVAFEAQELSGAQVRECMLQEMQTHYGRS